MKVRCGIATCAGILLGVVAMSPVTHAAALSQYASSAVASTEYEDYPASAATGAPDQANCGDAVTSWASADGNKTETLTLTFTTKVVPTSIKIWTTIDARTLTKVEVSGNGTTWTQVFSRSQGTALTTGATCALTGDSDGYPPAADAANGTVTPHTLTASNSSFPAAAVDRVRLTYTESLSGSITSLWGGETDAVQLIGNTPAAPTLSGTPSISGTAKVGKVLTAAAGTWSGAPTPTVAYQWYACSSKVTSVKTSVPSGCTVISGATARTFTLKSAQSRKYVGVRVTAANSAGSVVRFTATTTSAVVN